MVVSQTFGDVQLPVLNDHGAREVHHYAPLHYLVFIARSKALLSKPSLRAAGFGPEHLRSMSSRQDQARGFGAYAFLTLDKSPRILKAKLAAGFPHIGIAVPSEAIEACEFSLCRFNVAMTRYLRRDGKSGHPASASNGRYYPGHQIPIASTDKDKASMLRTHLEDKMIEVLIPGDLHLPEATSIICYSKEDAEIAGSVLSTFGNGWAVRVQDPPGAYNRNREHVRAVSQFIDRAIGDPDWRGDGLEFDRV